MKIIVDTNVISEVMRPLINESVAAWIDSTNRAMIAVTTITLEEVQYGLRLLPEGKRRKEQETIFDSFVSSLTILSFDTSAAAFCAEIRAERRNKGIPISLPDAQIAGIAKHHNAAVATRDSGGFKNTGVEIINPWAVS